jgi:GxxExxY protein
MDALVSQIAIIANDVYTSLGPGYNEVIYHRAMEVGLRLNGIGYESEVITPVYYKGHNIGHGRVDIKLENLIIELKAIGLLNNEAVVQTKNYMKQFGLTTGMVINFGQSVKHTLSTNLNIVLIRDDLIYDLIGGNFFPRPVELAL